MESLIANLIEELSKEGETQKQAYLQISAMRVVIYAMCAGLDDIKRQAIHNQIFEAFDHLELTDRTSTESEELRNATLKLLGTDILR
ncbi:sigma-S stabilization anti-adapter protein IraP [Enterobacter hormaechei]|uniref:sigma-S stabilization anti-adapter protein IraP n=1 Tax=Enterobacter cloacae complex TaxID=354276 RepID=UPI0005EEB099|nr:sigma-S stabilization anti-adapter protein IraP [Enterobacter hormaechei]HAS1812596.1 hypothetical protein [Enterobacter hormaechei subsp. xiangfangensis]KJP09593.1 hypothetical protein SS02_01855 [Enterobacter hormaechei subsp. steigerwaltii]KZQ17780.1 hypothetical protein A3N39_14400 [Enterobacter hormaechei subsp. steigerwaltii]MBG0518115.1 hypothetical protein [Enterobacter hormaechei]MBJ6600790.1 hypothetical protein [Enterobacter hormaechei]